METKSPDQLAREAFEANFLAQMFPNACHCPSKVVRNTRENGFLICAICKKRIGVAG